MCVFLHQPVKHTINQNHIKITQTCVILWTEYTSITQTGFCDFDVILIYCVLDRLMKEAAHLPKATVFPKI